MKNLPHIASFLLGALAAAMAVSQLHTAGQQSIPGTDRPWEDHVASNRYGFSVMQLDRYGGTNTGLTSAWSTAAVGPVLELRSHLAAQQRASLARHQRDPGEPVLARYEITEAWVDPQHATDMLEVPVRAVLYWTTTRPGTHERLGTVRYGLFQRPEGQIGVKAGAALSQVEVKSVDYFLRSNIDDKGVYGTDGWAVHREAVISTKTMAVGEFNDKVAFYDVSLMARVN